MAFSFTNFQPETFEQANPVMEGLKRSYGVAQQGLDLSQQNAFFPGRMQSQALENTLKQIEAKYAPAMTEAKLAQAQAEPGLTRAQTGLAGAQAGLSNQQAQQLAWLRAHPGYYLGGTPGSIEYLKSLGMNMNQGMGSQGGSPQNIPDQTSVSSPPFSPITDNRGMGGGSGIGGSMSGQQFQQGVNQNVQQATPSVPSIAPLNFGATSPTGNQNVMQSLVNQLTYGSPMDPITKARYDLNLKQNEANIPIASKELDRLDDQAKQSRDLRLAIQEARQGYANSTAKGGYFGSKPSSGSLYNMFGDWSPEQQVDNASAKAKLAIGQLPGSRTTDYLLDAVGQTKFGRQLDEQAFNNIIDGYDAAANRSQEEIQAKTQALSEGIPPQEVNARWRKYEDQFPAATYDKKSKQLTLHPGNMNKGLQMLRGENVSPTVQIRTSDGKVHEGPRENFEKVRQRDKGAQIIG